MKDCRKPEGMGNQWGRGTHIEEGSDTLDENEGNLREV